MTKKEYQLWLSDPKYALQALRKDIEKGASFDGEELLEVFIRETGYQTEDKTQLAMDKDVATWAYENDIEELFTTAMLGYFDEYDNYLMPVYETNVRLWSGQEETMTLHLSRTKTKVVVLTQANFDLGHGKEYEVEMIGLTDFNLEAIVKDFIGTANDFAAYMGGCSLITENIEELEEQGLIAGSINYESNLEWIEEEEEHYILT